MATSTQTSAAPVEPSDVQSYPETGGVTSPVEPAAQYDVSMAQPEQQSQGDCKLFWPADILPKMVAGVRIFTFGYDVDIVNFNPFKEVASQASVFQHARTLLDDLCDVRITKEEEKRPIIFIVHSLGGIVVKDALNQSHSTKSRVRSVLLATQGVCFLGTPHRGSGTASLGKIAAELSKTLLKGPSTDILETLEINSSELERIGKQFAEILVDRKVNVHTFLEEKPQFETVNVPRFSYYIGDGLETASGIPMSHSDMTRYTDASDIGLTRIVGVLQSWLKKADAGIDDNSRCLASLAIPATRARLAEVDKSFGNTYQWVFDDRIGFKDWLSNSASEPIFWIKGKPGSGKSTMMKYILQHPLTLESLHTITTNNWIIAGFFFHDRGSPIQKSILGLLSAILHKILLQRNDLMSFVLPIWQKSQGASLSGISQLDIAWTAEELGQALLAVLQQQRIEFSVCFFIDALDEHEGEHLPLIKIIRKISGLKDNSKVNIKLCLASREENVFMNEYSTFPGFAIHHHTHSDIENYALSRLLSEWPQSLAEQDSQPLSKTASTLTKMSQGVFIWVQLAIDELMLDVFEGEISGSISSKIEDLLRTIPTELKKLYERILKRLELRLDRRGSIEIRRQSVVMFQLALATRTVMPLAYFMNAASLLTTGWPLELHDTNMRRPNATREMILKLNTRCGGLLEFTVGSVYNADLNRETVQFIHQTAKEFIREKLTDIVPPTSMFKIRITNGHLLFMRYCVMAVMTDLDIRIPDFAYHAFHAEKQTLTSTATEFDRLLQAGSAQPYQYLDQFCSYLDFGKGFSQACFEVEHPIVKILLIAMFTGLFYCFEERFTQEIWSNTEYVKLLLRAVSKSLIDDETPQALDPRILQLMLSKADTHLLVDELDSLVQTILAPQVDSSRRNMKNSAVEIVSIFDLLFQYGARPANPIYLENRKTQPLEILLSRGLDESGDMRSIISEEDEVSKEQSQRSKWPSYELVEILLKAGALRGNVETISGLTPLMIAIKRRQISLTILLLRYGAALPPRSFINEVFKNEYERKMWQRRLDEFHSPSQFTGLGKARSFLQRLWRQSNDKDTG